MTGWAPALVGRQKVPSEHRFDAKQLEGIGRDLSCEVRLWSSGAIAESAEDTAEKSHAFERSGPRPFFKIRIVDEIPRGRYLNDAIVTVDERPSLEERGVDHGEDRGVDPDAESQHSNCDNREGRTLPQISEGVADVLKTAPPPLGNDLAAILSPSQSPQTPHVSS